MSPTTSPTTSRTEVAGPGGDGWGTSATAAEIAQQPRVWRELAATLTARGDEIATFLQPLLERPDLRIVLTGAGSSAFAGALLAPALAETTRRRVDPVATTTIVGGPGAVFVEDVPTLLVSFARSGNSPESVAATRLADQQLSAVWHLVVCCHADSDLARTYADDPRALVLLMPAATHDVGFAMTSSFTSMVLGCWFALTGTGPAVAVTERLARAAEALLADAGAVATLAERGAGRVAYLGGGPLAGLAQEAALKLLELTAGGVVGQHDTPLGFRHGPKAMLTDDTLVVVLRSADDYAARYDDDIVAELARELDPRQLVVLSSRPLPPGVVEAAGWTWQAEGLEGLGDVAVAVVDAVFAQLYALRSSIVRGLTPDDPFPSGEVNRVVRGVVVHPYPVRAGRVSPGSVFLGVDGGGTKTALCLVAADGTLLAARDAPSCYYLGAGQDDGPDLVRRVLGEAVPAVCADAGLPVTAVEGAFFGLPAYGEASGDLAELDAIPAAILGHDRYRCDNDMVCGWAGSLALEPGVNVVCGTGSMSYGERGDRRARVGGWGELVGDEGSAYWLGVRGLQAWTQMTDGRAPVGVLHAILGERLGLDDPLDLVSLVHETWKGDRRTIAALAPLVVRAAAEGDTVAGTIVDDAVVELARLVLVAAERLRFGPDEVVPVTGSGGVFGAATVRDALADRLRSLGAYVLQPSRFAPVVGAALYAARAVGVPLDAAALARLDRSVAGAAG